MIKTYGHRVAVSWLEIQLRDLSEFAGCKDKLTAAQINETAEMIADEYSHYRLTEFMLFFQRFKRCEYGKFYGRVDPMVLLQALRTFAEQRAAVHRDRYRQLSRNAEEEKRRLEDAAYDAMRQRYRQRVPEAFTPAAPIEFLQYQLLGYDQLPDEAFAQELQAITSGRKPIPSASEILSRQLGA